AGVERLEPGHLLEVTVDELGDPIEQGRALDGRAVPPVRRVERPPRGGDRSGNLGVGGDIDLGDDGAVRRIDDRAAGTIRGRKPLAIDIETGHGREDVVTPEPPSRAGRAPRVRAAVRAPAGCRITARRPSAR